MLQTIAKVTTRFLNRRLIGRNASLRVFSAGQSDDEDDDPEARDDIIGKKPDKPYPKLPPYVRPAPPPRPPNLKDDEEDDDPEARDDLIGKKPSGGKSASASSSSFAASSIVAIIKPDWQIIKQPPSILNVLKVINGNPKLVLEVSQQIRENTIDGTEGSTRGGQGYPVGALGRIVNVIGEPIKTTKPIAPIHVEALDLGVETVILATDVKVVDFLAPLSKAGKVGGVGKSRLFQVEDLVLAIKDRCFVDGKFDDLPEDAFYIVGSTEKR